MSSMHRSTGLIYKLDQDINGKAEAKIKTMIVTSETREGLMHARPSCALFKIKISKT